MSKYSVVSFPGSHSITSSTGQTFWPEVIRSVLHVKTIMWSISDQISKIIQTIHHVKLGNKDIIFYSIICRSDPQYLLHGDQRQSIFDILSRHRPHSFDKMFLFSKFLANGFYSEYPRNNWWHHPQILISCRDSHKCKNILIFSLKPFLS